MKQSENQSRYPKSTQQNVSLTLEPRIFRKSSRSNLLLFRVSWISSRPREFSHSLSLRPNSEAISRESHAFLSFSVSLRLNF